MNESRFWKLLREDILPSGHYSRIENEVDPGTPDVSFCVGGAEGFLELKYRPRYPRDPDAPMLGDRYGVRPTQRVWIRKRLKAGGRVWFLVGVARDLYVAPGSLVDHINVLPRASFDAYASLRDPLQARSLCNSLIFKRITRAHRV